jgi:membrane-bound ClpP family serine protease
MPSWNEILQDIQSSENIFDKTRRKYIKDLSGYTKRNTIIYYSAFLHKEQLARQGAELGINDDDKTSFMSCVHNMDKAVGLDIILHTPGGGVSATESIVYYLKSIFGNNIRAIIPQMAMSAGTMIACACKTIIMGKHSNLGPIDPQLGGLPAHGILEEFEQAKKEVIENERAIYVWREILQRYAPTLIGECQKAIAWAEEMVSEWLKSNMLKDHQDKDNIVRNIISELGSHARTLSHSRHIHINKLNQMGLKIEELEKDNTLQDLVLSVHHSTIIGLMQTKAIKIVENQSGISRITTFG